MSEKRNKYDTDPLDPDFVRHTDEMWDATRGAEQRPADDTSSEQTTALLPGTQPAVEQPRDERPTDAPTQRMDEHFSRSYPSVFIPPNYQQPPVPYQQTPPYQPAPSQYQQPYVPPQAGTTPAFATPERPVAGLNIKEKFACALPYVPSFIGLVPALIWLLLVPRQEVRVRFHAAQALALHLAILALTYLFTFVGFLTGSGAGTGLVRAAGWVFLLISLIRVWKGQEHRIGPLNDATNWLNQRINPRKS